MPITTLPTPPNKFSDTVQEFTLKADTFLAALPDFGDEANALATEVNGKEASAVSAASTATTKAAEAAASAATALAAPGTAATSTTSVEMGIGSKSFTIQTGKSFVVGMSVKIAVTAEPTRWMAGDITAYNSGTGALTVNVSFINGVPSTFAAWTISISGPGGGGGGLAWETQSGNTTALNGRGYAMDTTAGALTVTSIQSPQAGNTFAVGDLSGTFQQYNCTVNFGSDKVHGQAVGTMTLDVKNQRVTFVYMNTTVGYVITELEPNGSNYEYMPYAVMHVQERYAQNTDIPLRPAGNSVLPLNFTVKNDISGATINSNQITLPAGDYEVDGNISVVPGTAATIYRASIKTLSGTELVSRSFHGYGAYYDYQIPINGGFSLSNSDTIIVNVWAENGGYAGEAQSNQGVEVYSDLKITKIGGNYAPKPVVSAARLTPIPNLQMEGGVVGFDMTLMTGNTLTYGKGMCLDAATLTIPLAFTSEMQLVLPSTVNGEFFIFAVRRIDNGLCEPRAYSTLTGVASDPEIDAFRLIDYAKNNGSGVTMPYRQVGGRIDWLSAANMPVVTSTLTTVYAAYSLAAVIAVSLFRSLRLQPSVWNTGFYVSYNGTVDQSLIGYDYAIPAYIQGPEIAAVSSIYMKYNAANTNVRIASAMLRR